MKKFLILLTIFIFTSYHSYSQLKIVANGNVGIKTTNPLSPFAIGDQGYSDCTSFIHSQNSTVRRGLQLNHIPNSHNYNYGFICKILSDANCWKMTGIFSSATRATNTDNVFTYGIRGYAGRGKNGLNYGVMGKLEGDRQGTGILGCNSQHNEDYVYGDYAGYFRGDVYCEDVLSAADIVDRSDINAKRDIRYLKENENISKIKQLNGITYKLKHPSELSAYRAIFPDTTNFGPVDAPKYTKKRIGLVAQDVQKVYPELVDTDPFGYLTLNYIDLIPVLIEGIKEQQIQIEHLEAEIETMKKEIEIIKKSLPATSAIPK